MKLNDESGAGISIQASLQQAEAYAKHGQHAEAIKVYEQILASDPKNEDALVGKITSLRSHHQFAEAEAETRQALEQFPQNAKFLHQDAELDFDKHQYEQAIKKFEQILKDHPENDEAWAGKIKSLRSQYRFDAAEEEIRSGLEQIPRSVKIRYEKVCLLGINRQQDDEAIKVADEILAIDLDNEDAWERKINSLRCLRRFPDAERVIQEALKQLPQNVRILNEQGYLHADQQHHEAALKAFKQVLSIDSNDVNAFTGKIKALRSQEKWDTANHSLEEMRDRLSNSPEMLNECGWLYFDQKQSDKAIQAFEQSLKDVPNDENAWVGKIVSLRQQSDFDKAEQVIQEALSRLPRNVSILNQQGYLHADQQQHDKAIQAFEQTLEDSPDDEYAWKGKIDSLRSLRRFPEAEQAIREALTQLPQNVRILNEQGYLYAAQQQHEAALKAFEKGLSIDSNDVDAFDGKIKALRSLGKWDEANQAIQAMCDRPDNSLEMLNQCGDLYYFDSPPQYDKAIQAFQQTLKNSPDNEYARIGKIASLRFLKHFPEAEQVIQEALTRLPRSVNIRNQQAYLYADQQQYEKAIQVFDQTLNDLLGDQYTWQGKINYLRRMYRFDEAERVIQEALTRLPRNVAILNQQGYLYADQQQYKEALEAFKQVLSIDPTNVDAFAGKIQALRSLGKWDEANQAIQAMCDRSGNSPEILNKCGDLYWNQQQYDKAIQAFERTLKDFPNNEEAWAGKIASLRWQSDFDKAAQAIQGALTRLPQNINILHQQGYLYLDQHQYETAIQIFDRTLNDLPGNEYTWQGKIICLRLMYRFNEAEETAQKALKQLPQNITILNEEISLYRDQGQYDETIAICDEILKIDLANENAFSQKIGVLRSLNRFSDAEELIQEALTRLPRNVSILNQQGYLYAEQQQYEAALKAFRQVLFIDPTNVGAFVGKIQALRSQGNLDQANQALEKMCDHPGNSSKMLNQCGWLYFGQKQYDKAIQAFEQTLKYFPYDEEAWVGKIASLQWQPDFDKPDFDKAEQAIEESHKCLPRSQQIQAWQIRLHLHRRQYSQVIKDCQEILNKNPSHETALWGTIEAYREQSHFKDAGREMDDALRKLPYSVGLLNQKGTLFLSQRYYRKAYWAFGEALKINPTDEDAVIGQIRSKCQGYRFDKAEEIAQKFLQQPALSRNPRILNEQGRLYLVEKKYAEAIKVFEQILIFDPINEDAWVGQISCQRLQEFWVKAEQLIQKALRLLPNSARLLHEQSLFYRDRDQLGKADDCLEQAFRQDPTWTKPRLCQIEVKRRMSRPWDALKIIEELEKSFPDDLEVKAQKGWWYLRRNQSQKAKEAFNAIDEKYENNIEKSDGLRAVYFKQGNYEQAEVTAREVLKTEPSNPYFRANLAQVLLQQREKSRIQKPVMQSIWDSDKSKRDELLDEAEALCKKALEKDRHNELVLGCLGAIAYEKGRLLDTESYLLASIKEELRSGNHTSLGALYAHMGKDQEAKQNLETAIKFDDDDTQAYLELGNLYLKTDIERAIITFEKASAVDPESAEPQQALALAWMQKSEFDRAERILRRALGRLDKRMHQQLRLSLVRVLIRRGDQSREQGDDAIANQYYKDALKEALKLKRLQSECPEAYFFIGIIQFQFKEYKNALKSFEICLKNASPDEDYYFDVERNANLARIRTEKQIIPREEAAKIGDLLGLIFLGFLIALWIHYFWYKQGTMNETTMVLMTTLFLGLVIVAFLLPALSRLKLPGGFEAELTKPTPSVAKGPTSDSIPLSQSTSPTTPKENRSPSLNTSRFTSSPKQDNYGRN